MVCIELCSTRTIGNSALSGIVNVQALGAGGVVDIGVGNEASRGPLASATVRVRLRQSGGQVPNRWNAGVVTVVADTCGYGMQSMCMYGMCVCMVLCGRRQ